MALRCDLSHEVASAEWYVSRAAGCLAGYAARKRLPALKAALKSLRNGVVAHWLRRDFAEAYAVNSIKLGFPTLESGASEDGDFEKEFAA